MEQKTAMPNDFNLGFRDFSCFNLNQNSVNSAYGKEMNSMVQSIFDGGEMDFGKIMAVQLMATNPMAAFMLKDKIADGGDLGFKDLMMVQMVSQMANSNPFMAAMLMNRMKPESSDGDSKDSQVGFRGLKKDDNKYLSDDGSIADVKNQRKLTDNKERNFIKKTGDFSAPKESVAIIAKNAEGVDEDISKKTEYSHIVQDGKIDRKAAADEHRKLEKETKYNLTTEGIQKLNDKTPVKLDFLNYGEFGLDAEFKPLTERSRGAGEYHLTEKGREQLEILQKRGIVDSEGNVNKDKLDENQDFLKEQVAQNNLRDTMKSVSNGKNVYVKTDDAPDGQDTYSLAEVDRNGKIKGIEKNKNQEPVETKKLEHTDAAIAQKKIDMGGLDDRTMKKITKVNKDGSVEFDLTKLTPAQLDILKKDGIDYDKAAPLTIKDNSGEEIKINITGDANKVKLQGKTNAVISTENKSLQIEADEFAKISGIEEGDAKLEHLVIKGGNIVTKLDNLKNLQAVKLEKAKLQNDINITNENKDKNNTILTMSRVEGAHDVNVFSGGNVDIQAERTKLNKLVIGGENVASSLLNSKVKNVNMNATKDASIKGYRGSEADEVFVNAQNLKATYNGMTIKNETNLSGVDDKIDMFVSEDSKTGQMSLGAKEVELVGEDEKTAKKLKEETGKESKKLGDEKGDVSTETLFKKYFDFTNSDWIRYEQDLRSKGLTGKSKTASTGFDFNQILGKSTTQNDDYKKDNPWLKENGYTI